MGHRNTIVSHFSAGFNLLYADSNGTVLPIDQQIPVYDDSVYDMASLSKLFTTVLALDSIGRGEIEVNGTVASYLPQFATVNTGLEGMDTWLTRQNNKSTITIEQLMTHTSGFAPDPVSCVPVSVTLLRGLGSTSIS